MLLHKRYLEVHEEIEELLLFPGLAMQVQLKALLPQCTEAIKEALDSQKHVFSFAPISFDLFRWLLLRS